MSLDIATAMFAIVVFALFTLDRDRNAKTSRAVWIPVVWVSLAASRMVSQWFDVAPGVVSAEQALEGNALDRNILTALIAAGMFVLAKRRREVTALLRGNAAILIFFAYCAASILWSDYPDVALKRWIKSLGDLVMVLIVLTDRDRLAALKQFLARIGFILAPASMLLIKYYPGLGQNYSPWEGKVRYTGVALDKNMLGVICLITGLGCAWRLIELRVERPRTGHTRSLIAQATLLAVILWLFFKANSMTSLACFVLAVGLMAVLSLRETTQSPLMVHLLVPPALCFAFAVLFLGVGDEFFGTVGRDPTLTGRTELWHALLSMNHQPLFGAGFESFWSGTRLEHLWNIYWWHPNESHNGYLEIFLNLGWVGLGLLAMIVVTGYRNIVRAFRDRLSTRRLMLALFVVGVTYGFTEAAFRLLHPVWILFIMGTMSLPTSAPPRRSPSPAEPYCHDRDIVYGPTKLAHF